jgi:hypothetical protein
MQSISNRVKAPQYSPTQTQMTLFLFEYNFLSFKKERFCHILKCTNYRIVNYKRCTYVHEMGLLSFEKLLECKTLPFIENSFTRLAKFILFSLHIHSKTDLYTSDSRRTGQGVDEHPVELFRWDRTC